MAQKYQGTPTKLGEHIQTQKGYAFKSKWYTDKGIPIVKVSDFTDDSINTSSLTHIPGYIASEYSKFTLTTDDIVIQTVGSWPTNPKSVVGKVIRVPKTACGALLNQNAVRVDPDETLNQSFLFYLLKDKNFKHYILGDARGAASQASITLEAIRGFPFILPPLPTQRKIAAVLSAYDDLIENNTRRIAILEQMAQLIYREWFVHFRFPGHEDVAMVDSELGAIPTGWKLIKLGKVAKINRANLRKGNAPDWINYVNIGSVSEGRIEEIEAIPYAEAPSRARRVVQHGDIIWSKVRPYLKAYSLILDPVPNMIVSTGFVVITPKKTPYTYLYHAVTTDEFIAYLTNNATGAAYPAVRVKDFRDAQIVLPSQSLMEKYHDIIKDFFEEKQVLHQKNNILRRTRDLLLPRLIAGEVDVTDLDIV